MPTADPLIDFLRQQKQDAEGRKVNWARIRESWITDLRELMAQIRAWLKDAVAERLLEVREHEVSLTEDGLGTYTVPALTISAPRSRLIQIVPKARLIVGAEGRVDLESGPNRAKLIHVGKAWKFVREDFSGARLGRLSAPMKRELADLSEQKFRETIRELLA